MSANRQRIASLGLIALGATGCSALKVFVSPEGNIALGPTRAAAGLGPGGDQLPASDVPPQRHVARSAFDNWRPPPVGLLSPESLQRNPSVPVRLVAGGLTFTLRGSDRLVPTWGGDFYIRMDLDAGSLSERPPPRDIGIVIDTRERRGLAQARRLAAGVFETLRAGDRGTLVTSGDEGRVLVPLLSYGAAPMLVERSTSFVPGSADDLEAAIGHAVQLLMGNDAHRLRKLIVLWTEGDVISAETREWIQAATRGGIDVSLVPLTRRANTRLTALSTETEAAVLPEVAATDRAEHDVIDELSALPPARIVADAVTIAIDSLPGPMHLIEVSGARAAWTPAGGEVPLGDVREGDQRTLVLRGMVPAWLAGADFEVGIRVRYHDEGGAHESTQRLQARFTDSPAQQAWGRAGDVIQYVSMLNTLSTLQTAMVRHDSAMLGVLAVPAAIQARALVDYARTHNDPTMGEQAALVLGLLAEVSASGLAAPVP